MEDNVAQKIKSSSTSTASSLTEIQCREEHRITTEYYSLARHIDTEGESASRNDDTEETLTKVHLNSLPILWARQHGSKGKE
jgi:type IV secretory pathway VirB4 component